MDQIYVKASKSALRLQMLTCMSICPDPSRQHHDQILYRLSVVAEAILGYLASVFLLLHALSDPILSPLQNSK